MTLGISLAPSSGPFLACKSFSVPISSLRNRSVFGKKAVPVKSSLPFLSYPLASGRTQHLGPRSEQLVAGLQMRTEVTPTPCQLADPTGLSPSAYP